MVGDWQACKCPKGKRERIVKCVRPTGEGEGEVDVIPDGECAKPRPKVKDKCKCQPPTSTATTAPHKLSKRLLSDSMPLVPVRKKSIALWQFLVQRYLLFKMLNRHYFSGIYFADNFINTDYFNFVLRRAQRQSKATELSLPNLVIGQCSLRKNTKYPQSEFRVSFRAAQFQEIRR